MNSRLPSVSLPPIDTSHDTEIVEGIAHALAANEEDIKFLRERLPSNIFLLLSYRAMIYMAHHADEHGEIQ